MGIIHVVINLIKPGSFGQMVHEDDPKAGGPKAKTAGSSSSKNSSSSSSPQDRFYKFSSKSSYIYYNNF